MLIKEQRLKIYENKGLKRIYEPKVNQQASSKSYVMKNLDRFYSSC
jgi:hypothetical protein